MGFLSHLGQIRDIAVIQINDWIIMCHSASPIIGIMAYPTSSCNEDTNPYASRRTRIERYSVAREMPSVLQMSAMVLVLSL
jgi:hypothetical protein